jgi:hypothetical protein
MRVTIRLLLLVMMTLLARRTGSQATHNCHTTNTPDFRAYKRRYGVKDNHGTRRSHSRRLIFYGAV